ERLKGTSVGTEHLLLALASESGLASRALASSGIPLDSVLREMERMIASGAKPTQRPSQENQQAELSESAIEALSFAQDQARYFGQQQVKPEHILLGITDLKEAAANKILEEQGANISFLRRQVMSIMAQEYCVKEFAPSLSDAVVQGVKEVITD